MSVRFSACYIGPQYLRDLIALAVAPAIAFEHDLVPVTVAAQLGVREELLVEIHVFDDRGDQRPDRLGHAIA